MNNQLDIFRRYLLIINALALCAFALKFDTSLVLSMVLRTSCYESHNYKVDHSGNLIFHYSMPTIKHKLLPKENHQP